jgi:hypothetical protein
MQKACLQMQLLIFALLPAIACAQQASPSTLCARSETAKEFVQEAMAICLADLPSQRKSCMHDAQEEFLACGYKGSFTSLSNRHQARLVLLSFFKSMSTPPNSLVGLTRNMRHESE